MGQRIVPFIGYEDAAGAIEWLGAGFRLSASGATSGTSTAAGSRTRSSSSTAPRSTSRAPTATRARAPCAAESEAARRAYDNPWVIDGHFVEVEDVEAHYERARAAGATILREPEEPGIGFRIYAAEDPEGHRWMFGQRIG